MLTKCFEKDPAFTSAILDYYIRDFLPRCAVKHKTQLEGEQANPSSLKAVIGEEERKKVTRELDILSVNLPKIISTDMRKEVLGLFIETMEPALSHFPHLERLALKPSGLNLAEQNEAKKFFPLSQEDTQEKPVQSKIHFYSCLFWL